MKTLTPNIIAIAIGCSAFMSAHADSGMQRLQGNLKQGNTFERTFSAQKGQEVRISLRGSNQNVYFSLKNKDSQQELTNDTRDFWGKMPETGQYSVRLYIFDDKQGAKSGAFPYQLSISRLKLGKTEMTKMPKIPQPSAAETEKAMEKLSKKAQLMTPTTPPSPPPPIEKAPEPTVTRTPVPQVVHMPSHLSSTPEIEFIPKNALPPPPEPKK